MAMLPMGLSVIGQFGSLAGPSFPILVGFKGGRNLR